MTGDQASSRAKLRQKRPAEIRILFGYVMTKALPGIAIFAATPYWLSVLGFAEYAIYSTGWAISLVGSGLFASWLSQSLLRYTGDENRSYARVPSIVLPGTAIGAGAACGGAALVIGQFVGGFSWSVSAATGVLGAASVVTIVQSAVLQRHFMSGGVAWVLGIKTIGAVLISVLLIGLTDNASAVTILGSFAAAAICAAMYASLRYRAVLRHESAARSRATAIQFWVYGWPMAIWATASSMLLYSDRLALTITLGSEAAGEYAVIADLMVRGFSLIAFPVTMYVHPLIMNKANKGDASLISTVKKAVLLISALSGVFAVLASYALIAGSDMIGVDTDLDTGSILLVGVGAAAWQVGLVAHKLMEVLNKTREMAAIIVLLAVACFLFNLIMAPVIGLAVAPAVFCVGAVAYCLLTYTLGHIGWNRNAGSA